MSENFTQDFITSRRNYEDGTTRAGQIGRLWYDSFTNTIRIGDGTPGGRIVSAEGFGGSQGTQGDVGFTGSQGTQGTTGFTGSQGSQGTTGFTGSQGVGFTGSAGSLGFTITVSNTAPLSPSVGDLWVDTN